MDMAFCVAAGIDWNGNKTKPGDVIYLAGEGFVGLGRRFKVLEERYQCKAPRLFISEQPAQLMGIVNVSEVITAINEISKNPALIIIDTLHRNFGAGDENSSKDFGIFLGRVGTGKTTALHHYANNTPTAVLIESFEGIDHSTFMDELIKATGVTVSKGTAASKMAQLINALRATDKVILVDEANWLPKRSFGALRRISDVAEVGVVLVGTPDLLPMVQDPNGRFGQISSRIGFWPAVVQAITEKDCRALVNSYFSNAVDEATLKAFWSCCEGSARTLRNLLRNTYRSASKNKTEVSASLVKRINTQTMAGRGGFVAGRV